MKGIKSKNKQEESGKPMAPSSKQKKKQKANLAVTTLKVPLY